MNWRFFIGIFFCLLLVSCSQSSQSTENQAPASDASLQDATKTGSKKNIVFFGNSLTAAYGLDPSKGYVALVQQRLDSLGLPYRAINAGLSGETTAAGRERVSWVIKQPVDIFVLELGGNDALRGIQPETSVENLGAIIRSVKTTYPAAKIILAGMEAPPNMGPQYTSAFRQMYPRLAKEHGTALIPFFLANVGGIPELNQGDRIHPNEKGQYILLENVWKVLQTQL
ncbi:MAG: arylesterase [Bacteroidetes bacterium]|nr:arylesterase [Bacteroidota bacterium]